MVKDCNTFAGEGFAEPRLAGRQVVVTGGSGFVGRALVAGLLRSGARVRVVLRRDGPVPEGAEPVVVRRMDAAGLARAFDGAEVLFHFAYDMRAGEAANMALFDAVLSAARTAGVARIVQASSVAVYDDWPGDGPLNEDSPVNGPAKTAYAAAKRAMETRLLTQDFMAAAILQPTIVYGPGSRLWTEAALEAMRAGGVVLPQPCGICPAVHVEDVVQAALLAAAVPGLNRERFLINGPGALSWQAFYDVHREIAGTGEIVLRDLTELRDIVGVPAPQTSKGPSLAARLGGMARGAIGHDRVDRVMALIRPNAGPKGPAMPGPSHLALLAAHPEIVSDRARTRLGYVPRMEFRASMDKLATDLNRASR